MAVRNTAALRIPGDPMAGVLRQTARMARRTTRRTGVAGPEGPQGPAGPAGAPAVGVAATAVAMLVTDATGAATWPDGAGLVVVASAVGVAPVLVTVAGDQDAATVHTWTLAGEPAPGVAVSVAAFEPSVDETLD